MNIVWEPQERQARFMERPEYEVLYGGAAGGGKSDAMVIEALRQVDIPHYSGLILRRTYPQLQDLIEKSLNYYRRIYPGARYNKTEHIWRFPSGARVRFGSMQYEESKYDYQGQAFDFIGFDELTHFTQTQYMYMMSRNRPSGPGTDVYIRATANPGGVGHGWVKARFITPAKPLTTLWESTKIATPEGEVIKKYRDRIYVPATVFDNKKLLENDPGYVSNLALLPEAERNALLYGDWDSFEGQVFIEWKNDPDHYKDGCFTHVIDPFKVPAHWKIYRGFDFGYAKPFSVAWYAVDENGCIYRIQEYYGCTGVPNVGLKIDPHEIARNIRDIEQNDINLSGRKIYGIADPSIFDKSRGESIAEQMEKEKIYWEPGDNNRIAGKMQYHYRFAFNDHGAPMLQIFKTCKEFIRTIPALVYDEKHVEDINTDTEDHIYDECRYVLMANPIGPRKNILQEDKYGEDPLNLRPNTERKRWWE